MSLDFSPQLRSFLDETTKNGSSNRPVAVFDCDGTIIKGDIGEAMLYHQLERFQLRVSPANLWLDHPKREELDNLYNALAALPVEKRTTDRRYVSFSEMVLEWYFGQLMEGKTEKACADIVKLLSKFTLEEVEKIARATFQEEVQAPVSTRKFGKHNAPKGIRYIFESVKLLTELQSRGFDIWAVSGSNKWSIQPVFERLNIPRERLIGIDLEASANVLTPRVQNPVPVLEGKVEILKQKLAEPPLIVVSDSTYDVPLFEYSRGLKVLINSRMETSYTFFKQGNITRDDSWVVIEQPTVI